MSMTLEGIQLPLPFEETLPTLSQVGYYLEKERSVLPTRPTQEELDIDPNHPDGYISDLAENSLLA